MASLNNMVKRCSGLIGTKDVSDWEDDFLKSLVEKTQEGRNTSSLTEKQITILERIFEKNYSD
jgi:hypothetical protein